MTFRHQARTATGTWIVVADRGRARILSRPDDPGEPLDVVVAMEHADAGQPMHEQVSDQAGYFRGRSASLDAGDPQTDFRHKIAQEFAREIVKHLEDGRQQGRFGNLILVAAPLFLGVLKSQLGDPLAKLVKRSIDKDYTGLAASELTQQLAKQS